MGVLGGLLELDQPVAEDVISVVIGVLEQLHDRGLVVVFVGFNGLVLIDQDWQFGEALISEAIIQIDAEEGQAAVESLKIQRLAIFSNFELF